MTQPTAPIDLDLLAYDIADMLDRYGYDLDVSSEHIRPALPAFLAAIQANAAGSGSEPSSDAATWTPDAQDEPEPAADPTHQPPRLGRVRVYPMYVFRVWLRDGNAAVDVVDLDKRGEEWARLEAARIVAGWEDGAGAEIGSRIRKGTYRWHPYAGTPKDAKPW